MATAKDIDPSLLRRFRAWRDKNPESDTRGFRHSPVIKRMHWKPHRCNHSYCIEGTSWTEGVFLFTAHQLADHDTSVFDFETCGAFSEGSLAHGRCEPWRRDAKRPKELPLASFDRFHGKEPRSSYDRTRRFLAPSTTYDELLDMYWFKGYRKFDADLLARKAWRAIVNHSLDWLADRWHYVGISVEATACGTELSSDARWGIDSEDDGYLDEVARECAYNQMDKAREGLRLLAKESADALMALEGDGHGILSQQEQRQ